MLTKAIIKDIQSLQHKKFRDESGLFIAEGPKVVKELAESGVFELMAVYALESWVDKEVSWLPQFADFLQKVTEFELERISQLVTPNQVLAVFKQKVPEPNFNQEGIVLVLDDIRDPGNLGTIIRTADWFGVKNIVCSVNTVDQYNPKVVQSTMASLAQVNVVYTDLEQWIQNEARLPVYAATLDGESVLELNPENNMILIIGNESAGISNGLLKHSKQRIHIPRIGQAESLNAAVATAVLLYHFSSRII